MFSCHANQHNDEYRNGDRSRLPIGKEILGAIEDRGIICPYKLVVNAQCGLVMGITGACVNAGERVIRFGRSRPEPVIQREPRSTGTR